MGISKGSPFSWGLALFSLASGLYLFLTPQWLVLIRLLQGAGAAFFSIMSMTLLIRYFSDRKGTVLGIGVIVVVLTILVRPQAPRRTDAPAVNKTGYRI